MARGLIEHCVLVSGGSIAQGVEASVNTTSGEEDKGTGGGVATVRVSTSGKSLTISHVCDRSKPCVLPIRFQAEMLNDSEGVRPDLLEGE